MNMNKLSIHSHGVQERTKVPDHVYSVKTTSYIFHRS